MADETVVAQSDVTEEVKVSAEEPKAEGQPDPQASQNEGEPHKKLGGWQRKQLKAEAEARQKAAEAEYWRNVALENLAKKPADKPKEDDDPEPDPDDYTEKTLGDYIKDMAAWSRRQGKREALSEFDKRLEDREKSAKQKTKAEQDAETWREREEAVAKQYEDYEELSAVADSFLRANQQSQSVQALGGAIGESEIGPLILRYLGENEAELQRIAKLSPIRAIAEIGKIEAKLASQPPEQETEAKKPAPAPVSKAPKPPQPVKKTAPADDGELRDDLAPEEWSRRFLKKIEKR